MEFFLGTFEREWERRRAAILYELQMEQLTERDWNWPRRGGVARLWDDLRGRRLRGRGVGRPTFARSRGGIGRSMRARVVAIARGSQPAVVKLASYGGGARAAAMMAYMSRNGELAIENEKGERVAGKAALAEQRSEWEYLFDNRAASRDAGMFQVTIDSASIAAKQRQDDVVRAILHAGFGDRRFVYAIEEWGVPELRVHGVAVLRDRGGERLTGDIKASSIVQERFDESELGTNVDARFRFRGYGNGIEFGTARVRELVQRYPGNVRDETGRRIETLKQAGDLVQREWRTELHSRKGRDVMHLVVSARAGTDVAAFHGAVRDFLGGQFAGHRYVFSMHDPSNDPKDVGEGGKRPHVHAHAIVTMRSVTGVRLETSPRMFRQWRSLMAAKARDHGIDMEMTDRREFANAPAYARNQVRPLGYSAGRTEHEGTSEVAQLRYDAKRSNQRKAAGSERSKDYVAEATRVWREIARDHHTSAVADFAASQIERIRLALYDSQIDIEKLDRMAQTANLSTNMVTLRELLRDDEAFMRAMTRPEFQAYEKRVEAVLTAVGMSVEPSERKDFEEVAATARDVVSIRREYLEFIERQADAGVGEPTLAARDDQQVHTVTKRGRDAVEAGNGTPMEIEAPREPVDRASDDGRDPTKFRSDPNRETGRGAFAGNTKAAETDRDLRMAVEMAERLEGQSHSGGEGPAEGEKDEIAETIASTSEARRSDSAQQHVPRLREPKREIEERHDRDRDDFER